MPSSSQRQHDFMEAIAHSAKFAKKAGVPVSVGQDFAAADKKSKKFAGGGPVQGPLTQSRNLLTQTVVQPSDVDRSDLRTSLPRVYGALAGLMGTPPDQLEGSVLEPGYDARQQGAAMTFPIGTALQMLPGLKGLATAMAAEKLVPSGSLAAQRGMAKVWHGSPHTFDAFDASKIGTGEGAQAFGHGLYLAESPGVAKSYKIAGNAAYPNHFINGVKLNPDDMVGPKGDWGLDAGDFQEVAGTPFGEIKGQAAKDALIQAAKYGGAQSEVDRMAQIPANQFKITRSQGNLYKVDIPDEHIARMLNYDTLLSDHPESVRNAIANMDTIKNLTGQEIAGRGAPPHLDPTGSDIYGMLQARNGPVEASRMLRDAGIPGIKYLDGGSRAAGEGTSNYVLFPGNESKLQILERNGQPLTPPATPDTAPSDAPQQYAQGGSVQDPTTARLHHIVFVKPLDQIGPEDHDFINSLIQKGQN